MIVVGKVAILKGTKNSVQGDHVWLEDEDNIYDPTLMVTIPKNDMTAKLYSKEYTISSSVASCAELSYSDDFYLLESNPNQYYAKLFIVKENKEIESI